MSERETVGIRGDGARAGVFITFEGVEGCGKSTQARLFAQRLSGIGAPVRALREPGGTQVGEAIRSILLDPANAGLDARAELLLYEASRAQLVAEVIEPALAAGEVVICDRFYDSTTAYQGYARGIPLGEIEQLNGAATGGLAPDLTIVVDVDPALGLERACRGRDGADRLEAEELAFHERVRDGFLAVARVEPERVVVVSGDGTLEEVAERIDHAVRSSGLLAGVFPAR
jgi:dTMP kinase